MNSRDSLKIRALFEASVIKDYPINLEEMVELIEKIANQ
jgi:hypothetical protein